MLQIIHGSYSGQMIGVRHEHAPATLWLTADHQVLAKLRPRALGGDGEWSAIPKHHFERGRELRRNQTPAEQRLWAKLRGEQLGYKFRRQHPIGPYIADFYSRDVCLVVELDGDTHSTVDAQAYDAERDRYMRSLGLDVLRFTNADVYKNLDGVVAAINLQRATAEHAEWVRANLLQHGDIIFFGVERTAMRIIAIETQPVVNEEVYDLQVEDAHSYVTEVCAVHNCKSGSIAHHLPFGNTPNVE